MPESRLLKTQQNQGSLQFLAQSQKILEPVEFTCVILGRRNRRINHEFISASEDLIPPKSDQKWAKAGYDAINKWDHFVERFNDGPTFDNPRLVERYVKGELQLLIHFFVTGHPDENYVAHLGCLSSFGGRHKGWGQGDKWKNVSVASVDHQLLHGILDKDTVVDQGAGEHPTMFVHYVESMESP
jgi:hypothetical protein